jgi:hypothetical protein
MLLICCTRPDSEPAAEALSTKGTTGVTCNTSLSAHIQTKNTVSRTPVTTIGSAQSKLDIAVIKERTGNITNSNSLQNEALEKPLLKTSIGYNLIEIPLRSLGLSRHA